GSDGAWQPWLAARGVPVAPLVPSNCGFERSWSDHYVTHHAGAPVKPVAARCVAPDGTQAAQRGEFVITAYGLEGSLVYALSAPLRDAIARDGSARLELDLLPDHPAARVETLLARPRGKRSVAEWLKRSVGLSGVKAALLREVLPRAAFDDPLRVARCVKALPLELAAARPLAEAISSGGGVRFEGLDEHLMLHALPGVFCAGEMIDWEAPTGGYLLTACFSTGHRAGRAAAGYGDDAHPG
ncbi:MAG: TIGR03862 family flavoprotein, partial [Gammaproteobacteria bacterium]